MDEQFITDGLAQNRYLKAQRLVTRFEAEVTDEIDAMCRSVRQAHPTLFDADASLRRQKHSGKTVRTIRTEVRMTRTNDEGNNLTINVALEWVEPAKQPTGHANVTADTLCYLLYKIKYGSARVFEAVKDGTRQHDRWVDLRFGDEQFDTLPKVAPGIVYLPVEAGSDIVDGLERLEHHFTDMYAPKIRS